MAVPKIGTGTTLTYLSASHEILTLDVGGMANVAINTSHMGTTSAHTFIPGNLYDPGEVTIEIQHDAAEQPKILAASANTLVITFSDSSTMTGSCFVTAWDINATNEGLNTATVTLKASGAWAFG